MRHWAAAGAGVLRQRLAAGVLRQGLAAGVLATLAATLLMLSGCAILPHRHLPGVPIEQRPTPPQPPPPDSATAARVEAPEPKNAPAPSVETEKPAPAPSQPSPVEAVMSPEERKASLERIVADTTAASAAVKKCVGKSLLPDQESVFETARSLLLQARAAIARDELWRAESLARKARQLALSLDCR